ncbi:MAG TPA: hypothetical protein DET40_05085 [Lentisphaeria bacterium]|nr:MAG: hypothetical protein A2X45_13660 [Lentisphaerae bacterium GWF2_50_93]HCE42901.1 hypothetical protein [Lentisphaeria bacterium]
MNFYEVLLGVISQGKEIGRICVFVAAASPFTAAVQAEEDTDKAYGSETYSHAVKVNEITEEEFHGLSVA